MKQMSLSCAIEGMKSQSPSQVKPHLMKVNELQLLYYYSCFLFLSASVSFNQVNFILDVMTEHIAFSKI